MILNINVSKFEKQLHLLKVCINNSHIHVFLPSALAIFFSSKCILLVLLYISLDVDNNKKKKERKFSSLYNSCAAVGVKKTFYGDRRNDAD